VSVAIDRGSSCARVSDPPVEVANGSTGVAGAPKLTEVPVSAAGALFTDGSAGASDALGALVGAPLAAARKGRGGTLGASKAITVPERAGGGVTTRDVPGRSVAVGWFAARASPARAAAAGSSRDASVTGAAAELDEFAGEALAAGAKGKAGSLGAMKPIAVRVSAAGARFTAGVGAPSGFAGDFASVVGFDGTPLAAGAKGKAGSLGAMKPIAVPVSAAGARFTTGAGASSGFAGDFASVGWFDGAPLAAGAKGKAGSFGAMKPIAVPVSAAGARFTVGMGVPSEIEGAFAAR
jgi:hypothetical protein